MKWILCLLFAGVAAEKGIGNVINVGSDEVPYDSCSVAVGYNEDSRVELFVWGADDAIWHRAQPTYTSSASNWTAWQTLGGAFRDGPTVIRNSKGQLMVFTRGQDNLIYYKAQTKANGGADDWGAWEHLGDFGTNDGAIPASRPSVVLNSEGLVHVFVRATDNTLRHRSQLSNDTNIFWGNWENLGGALSGSPTAIVDSEGLLHIFARATDRSLFHLTQIPKAEYMTWNTWKTMGGTLASNPRVTLIDNDVNLLEVIVRGSDKAYWVKAQVSNQVNVTWSKWGSLGGLFASGPATLVNEDGFVDVYGRGVDKRVYGRSQYMVVGGTAWSSWTDFGGVSTTAPDMARRPDGTVILVTRNSNKGIDMKYQIQNTTDFSLSWSNWMTLGGVTKTFAC